MRPDRQVLSSRLDREWRALRHDPAALARVRSWALTPAAVGDLDELLVLAGYRVPHTPGRNALLLRLVVLAADDELAARIVLQRLLPGLLAVIRRRRRSSDGSFEELLGA